MLLSVRVLCVRVCVSSHLGVDDDLHIHGVLLLQPLDSCQGDPQIVGVEDLELGPGLELDHMGLGHLGDLQQPQLAVVLDEGATLRQGRRSAE